MTLKEAIKILKIDLAIQKEFKALPDHIEALEMVIEILEQEPCNDCISRQEVIDAFWKLNIELRPSAIDAILNMVNDMPPVRTTTCIAKISFDDQQMKEMIDKAIFNLDFSDLISRQAVLSKIETVCFSKEEEWIKFRADYGSNGERDCIINYIKQLPSVQPEQKVIRCKDCNEWLKGKNHDGSDVYSDEGYCSVHRIITGENYYCGDAERR